MIIDAYEPRIFVRTHVPRIFVFVRESGLDQLSADIRG